MIIKRKLFSKAKNESKEIAKDITGIGLALGGAKLIKDSNKNGELSGRVKLYYSVNKKHIPDILRNGLDGKYSRENPDSLTNKVTDGKVSGDKRNIIYLAKDKELADRTGINRERISNGIKKSKTLKVEVLYEELKSKRTYGNPEFNNAKTFNEYIKFKTGTDNIKNIPKEKLKELKDNWRDLGGDNNSRTIMLDGKLGPENFKNSNKFRKNSIKEIAKYIKSNPGRFTKGIGKVGIGASSILAGTELIRNSKKDTVKDNMIGGIIGGVVAKKFIKESNKNIKEKENLLKYKIENENKNIDRKVQRILNDKYLDPKLTKEERRKLNLLKIRENAEKQFEKERKAVGKFKERGSKILSKSKKLGKIKGGLIGIGTYGTYITLKHKKKGGKDNDKR